MTADWIGMMETMVSQVIVKTTTVKQGHNTGTETDIQNQAH